MSRRRVGKALAALLAAAMTAASAASAAPFLPDAVTAPFAQPFQAVLTADVQTLMPLEETRTADLNRLVGHLSLSVAADPASSRSRASILVDGETAFALTLASDADEHLLIAEDMPGGCWRSFGDPAEVLFPGDESPIITVWCPEPLTVLSDLDALTENLASGGPGWTEKKDKQSVTGYGKTTVRKTLTLRAKAAAGLGAILTDACPDGPLREFLTACAWSGRQTVTLLCTDEGDVLKVTYSGKMTFPDGTERNVSFSWKRLRGTDREKDLISLKSPSTGGSAVRDNLSFERETAVQSGSNATKAEFSYDRKRNKDRCQQSGTWSMTLSPSPEGDRWHGKAEVKETLSGGTERKTVVTLTPELLCTDGTLNGTTGVECKVNSHRTAAFTLTLSAGPVDILPVPDAAGAVPLDGMDADAAAAERTRLTDWAVQRLVPLLMKLPGEDILFLTRDLPELDQTMDQAG